ncbi:MAG: transcriptional regulator, MerR family, partial [uncultured bacterium]
MTSLTVGRLARKFGLSRSTLLYYDAIGLLSPAGHIQGEYRLYGPSEEGRLEQICRYRRA